MNSVYNTPEYQAATKAYIEDLARVRADFVRTIIDADRRRMEELIKNQKDEHWRWHAITSDHVTMPRLSVWDILRAIFS